MIVVFGSINLDLIFALPAIPRPGETVLGPDIRIEPGGKGANQAVAAARDGAQVVMAGAVGRDALAAGALALLRDGRGRPVPRDRGRGRHRLRRHLRSIRAAQQRDRASAPAPTGWPAPTRWRTRCWRRTTTLVLQMEVPAAETASLIRRARPRGARIMLNLAPAAPLPTDGAARARLLLVNETEAAWLCRHLGCGDGRRGAARTRSASTWCARSARTAIEAATRVRRAAHPGPRDHAGRHHRGRGLLRRRAGRRAGSRHIPHHGAGPRQHRRRALLPARRQPIQPADRRRDRHHARRVNEGRSGLCPETARGFAPSTDQRRSLWTSSRFGW